MGFGLAVGMSKKLKIMEFEQYFSSLHLNIIKEGISSKLLKSHGKQEKAYFFAREIYDILRKNHHLIV
tara:strand:+ start:124 stop:327 length:204 start_codon:yes stop_codon:yes gene_type:complete